MKVFTAARKGFKIPSHGKSLTFSVTGGFEPFPYFKPHVK